MLGSTDFSSFPVREGMSVPRDFVLPMEDGLVRGYGVSLKQLARRGGVSVYELLLLLPPPDGTTVETHRRRVCDLTVSEALNALDEALVQFHKQKEAEAEAEMLRLMEEGGDGDVAMANEAVTDGAV